MDNSTYEIMLKKALSDFARGMAGVNSNGITYDDAFGLADECGISASGALSGVTDAVINGEISLSEGKALIARVMSASSTLSESFAMEAQSVVNAEAGVNLEILGADRRAALNRISNLTEKYGSYADLQKGDFLLGEAIQSVFARQTVADTARRNADFHESAGLHVKINRIGGSGCCTWCGGLTGIYDKESAPKDIWRFHKNCNCSLEYKSGKTSSRISFKTGEDGSMEKVTKNLVDGDETELKNTASDDTIDLKSKISNINKEISGLKQKFSSITEGYSYDEWFKDFKTIEEGYGGVITDADKPDVQKLKSITQKIKDAIQKKAGLESQLPILGGQGSPMNIADALRGANPNYAPGTRYSVNCQRCVQAYELRRRGYDVEALPKPRINKKIVWGNECFVDSSGKTPNFLYRQSEADIRTALANAPDGSRHIVYASWSKKRAHVFIAEKENGVVRYVDPQSNNPSVENYFSLGQKNKFGILRVDDKGITSDASILKATVRW